MDQEVENKLILIFKPKQTYFIKYHNLQKEIIMKTAIKSTIAIAATAAAIAGVAALPTLVSAWGDNGPRHIDPVTGEEIGRLSYTIDQINAGAIGATPQSDGANYKSSPNYPGQIIFNTISNSTIGDEKNFVGARECAMDGNRCLDAETKANPTQYTKWQGNNITVEDGKTYTIRIYAHNNNPNGEDAIAENTRVAFSIPNGTSKQIQVNGFISSSNATPSKYWDYVNFNSEVPFHLDYVYGSALLNNNKTQEEAAAKGDPDHAGWALSDDIVKAASTDGVLIGYDSLNGKVPGCYQYASYITIQVKAIFDYEYTVDKKVRIAGSEDRTWRESVDAKVGDKVEFRIGYRNTSNKQQDHVAIKDILPSNLKYVAGSTILKNSTFPNGLSIDQDYLTKEGFSIGSYGPNANAYVYFTAEVVNDNLACGDNTLINWAQAGVGQKTIQDNASVKVNRYCENTPTIPTTPTDTPKELPTTGPEAIVGGVIATGSIVTAAGYYIASRRQLR